ncbi:unnamed protein product [Toxocara canis]|uniref:Secreted protein n=1 Tax=Toxocara canis TaxID=6265 RepID=A0A183TWN9_TOXCA|nr:unnamed protein product [Toxocara canis]
MFATRRALICLFLIYLLAQPAQTSWLSKTYKKLENSAKKRIAEGIRFPLSTTTSGDLLVQPASIAIAIQGGPRRHRSVPEPQVAPSHADADQLNIHGIVQR